MARIRSIKPEFWADETIGQLSIPARLLFIATWNLADDAGRLRWNARYLKSQVFMYDDGLTLGQITELMRELTEPSVNHHGVFMRGSRIMRYVVDGECYALIRNFGRHQKINRASEPKLPPPPDESPDQPPPEGDSLSPQGDSLSPPGGLRPRAFPPPSTSPSPSPLLEELKNRATVQDSTVAEDDRFPEWYAIYPRHKDRADAAKAWKTAVAKHGADLLIAEAGRWAALWAAAGYVGDEQQFIPYPAKWLRRALWTDDPPRPRLRAVAGDPRPSTTDQRVAQGLQLVAELEALEAIQEQNHHQQGELQ